jgi:CRP-like cAMP-binding protein
MPKVKTLRSHPLFSALTDRELAFFSRIVHEVDYSAGSPLFTEGMKSATFYLVQKGRVGVAGSAVPRTGAVLGEGEFLGQWSLLGPEHACAVTAKVLEESSLLLVRRADFEGFMAEEPGTALKVVRALLGAVWDDVAWLRELALPRGKKP